MNNAKKLALMIERESVPLLARWRDQVRRLPSGSTLDVPALNDHIPDLLVEIAAALTRMDDETIVDALLEKSPPIHGTQRLALGFDVTEVVAEYNILRGCIHDLAMENDVNLVGTPFHIINRVLDEAIGLAVDAYAKQRAADVQQRRDEYLAFVTHDLRTPLHAISLAASVMERVPAEQSASPQSLQMIKSLRRNVVRLERLIEKVLDEASNVESDAGLRVEKRMFDLWPLVQGQIQDLEPLAANSQAKLTNQVPYDVVMFADATLIRRVLQNLIANGINYTPGGEIVVGAEQDADKVVCWVSDNGAGIAAENIDRIFDKSFTDRPDDGHNGLGLTIVKSLVEAHDGAISVESTAGEGSTFRFTIPAASASPSPAMDDQRHEARPPGVDTPGTTDPAV